jgi:tRNA(Ile)-lysidine synthase
LLRFRDLDYGHVERVLEFSEHPSHTGRAEICQGLGLRLSGGRLILQRQAAEVRRRPDWTGTEVPRQGRIRLEELEWVIEARSVRNWDWRRVKSGAGRWEAWLDRDRMEGNLTVRVRARGDRFRGLGMDQEVRLGDFLSAHHLPADLRDRWPLICDGLGIVWIPGLQIGERPKLRPVSRRVLHLRVWREG